MRSSLEYNNKNYFSTVFIVILITVAQIMLCFSQIIYSLTAFSTSRNFA